VCADVILDGVTMRIIVIALAMMAVVMVRLLNMANVVVTVMM
jgi:hypothetical protein